MDPLDVPGIVITVRRSLWRRGTLAEAGKGGRAVWLSPGTLRFGDASLFYVICEEVAHCALARGGGPRGSATFHDAIVHEAFANWYAYRQSVGRDPAFAERAESQPLIASVLSHRSGYEVGAVLGRAAAGSSSARNALTRWRTTTLIEPGFHAMVRRLTTMLERDADPLRMCMALAEFSARAGAEDGRILRWLKRRRRNDPSGDPNEAADATFDELLDRLLP